MCYLNSHIFAYMHPEGVTIFAERLTDRLMHRVRIWSEAVSLIKRICWSAHIIDWFPGVGGTITIPTSTQLRPCRWKFVVHYPTRLRGKAIGDPLIKNHRVEMNILSLFLELYQLLRYGERRFSFDTVLQSSACPNRRMAAESSRKRRGVFETRNGVTLKSIVRTQCNKVE